MRVVAAVSALLAFSLTAADIPRSAQPFSIMLPDGGQLALSQYKGKVVLIEFLYTTCPHCQKASALLNKLQGEYGAKGFQPLGVAFNPMAHMLAPDFVRDFQVKYPVGYQTREAVHTFLQHDPNHMLSVPQIVFLDRQGAIRYQSRPTNDAEAATEGNLRKWIELLLKEPAPAARKRS